jgi:hypothetical protein
MVDDLIRGITEPEAAGSADAKSAARKRLLAAAGVCNSAPGERRRLGRRGLALLVALLAIPTGAALATGLGTETDQPVFIADCPELLAAVEQEGLSTEGLVLAGCPVGAEIDQTLALLAELARRRAELERDGGVNGAKAILGIGREESGELWHFEGISGREALREAGYNGATGSPEP